MPGAAFITVEGVEGVGKSTSLAVIQEFLRAADRDIRLTREPGGTALGEQIREWVLHAPHGDLKAEVEALLMFAARAQHLQEVIRPALASGCWVVCDRFTDATMAYQGGGGGADRRFLEQLRDGIQGDLNPDLTLLLDAPVEIGFARISKREHDHFERQAADFFERVRATYLDIAAREPARVKLIDATASREAVRAEIERCLTDFIAAREAD